MRRSLLLLISSLALLAQTTVVARADDPLTLTQRLATASADITNLNDQIAALDQKIASTEDRVAQERQELMLLGRTMYAEPDSLLVVLAESQSLADALTRFTDLAVAGERAAATKHALDGDLSSLARQRADLVAALGRQRDLRQHLEDEYSGLQRIALTDPALAGDGTLPAPSSQPSTPSGAGVGIQKLILDSFAPLGSGAQSWAIRIAKCESGYNPFAVNGSSGASGLFQFLPSTWAHSPWAGQSPFDPVANAQAAAWLYSRSGPAAWQCK